MHGNGAFGSKNHQGRRPSAHTSEVQRRLASLPGSSVNSPTQPEVSHRCGTWLRLVIHPILYRTPFALPLPLFSVSISTLGGSKAISFSPAQRSTLENTHYRVMVRIVITQKFDFFFKFITDWHPWARNFRSNYWWHFDNHEFRIQYGHRFGQHWVKAVRYTLY